MTRVVLRMQDPRHSKGVPERRMEGISAQPQGALGAYDRSGPAMTTSGRETTLVLLERAKTGDEAALNELLGRYRPVLRRWASGRLPRNRRDLLETDDLVQETLVRAI